MRHTGSKRHRNNLAAYLWVEAETLLERALLLQCDWCFEQLYVLLNTQCVSRTDGQLHFSNYYRPCMLPYHKKHCKMKPNDVSVERLYTPVRTASGQPRVLAAVSVPPKPWPQQQSQHAIGRSLNIPGKRSRAFPALPAVSHLAPSCPKGTEKLDNGAASESSRSESPLTDLSSLSEGDSSQDACIISSHKTKISTPPVVVIAPAFQPMSAQLPFPSLGRFSSYPLTGGPDPSLRRRPSALIAKPSCRFVWEEESELHPLRYFYYIWRLDNESQRLRVPHDVNDEIYMR